MSGQVETLRVSFISVEWQLGNNPPPDQPEDSCGPNPNPNPNSGSPAAITPCRSDPGGGVHPVDRSEVVTMCMDTLSNRLSSMDTLLLRV